MLSPPSLIGRKKRTFFFRDVTSAGYCWEQVFLAKTEHLKQAQKLFIKENVEIVDGHRVLGSVIGSESACEKFRNHKQSEYNQIVEKLSKHAKIFPQNVFHCFTKGLQNKVTFLSRTTPNFIETLEETERKIKVVTVRQCVTESRSVPFQLFVNRF